MHAGMQEIIQSWIALKKSSGQNVLGPKFEVEQIFLPASWLTDVSKDVQLNSQVAQRHPSGLSLSWRQAEPCDAFQLTGFSNQKKSKEMAVKTIAKRKLEDAAQNAGQLKQPNPCLGLEQLSKVQPSNHVTFWRHLWQVSWVDSQQIKLQQVEQKQLIVNRLTKLNRNQQKPSLIKIKVLNWLTSTEAAPAAEAEAGKGRKSGKPNGQWAMVFFCCINWYWKFMKIHSYVLFCMFDSQIDGCFAMLIAHIRIVRLQYEL